MNNIHEKDWASGCWAGHTGMDSGSDYCTAEEEDKKTARNTPEPSADRVEQEN